MLKLLARLAAALRRARKAKPVQETEWLVWDDELDADLSDAERRMLRDGRIPTAAENRALHAADNAQRAKEAQLRHLRGGPPC